MARCFRQKSAMIGIIAAMLIVTTISFSWSTTAEDKVEEDSNELLVRVTNIRTWMLNGTGGNVYLGGYSVVGNDLYLFLTVNGFVETTSLAGYLYAASQEFSDYNFDHVVLYVGIPQRMIEDRLVFLFYLTLEAERNEEAVILSGVGISLVKKVIPAMSLITN